MQPQLPLPGRGPEAGDRALEHDAAPVDHHDLLAEVLDEVELVAGKEHDPALPRALP